MLLRHDDGQIYLTTDTVADLFGVDKSTVSAWRHRGLLTVALRGPRQWPLYTLQDAAKAEKISRDNRGKRDRFLAQIKSERITDLTWPAAIKE